MSNTSQAITILEDRNVTVLSALTKMGCTLSKPTASQPACVVVNAVFPGQTKATPIVIFSNKTGSYTLRPSMDGIGALLVVEGEKGILCADVQELIDDVRHTRTWQGTAVSARPHWNGNYKNKRFAPLEFDKPPYLFK